MYEKIIEFEQLRMKLKISRTDPIRTAQELRKCMSEQIGAFLK